MVVMKMIGIRCVCLCVLISCVVLKLLSLGIWMLSRIIVKLVSSSVLSVFLLEFVVMIL